MKSPTPSLFTVALFLTLATASFADPFAKPGENLLRSDLQLLNDSGILNMPLTAWPVSLGDVSRGLQNIESGNPGFAIDSALARVRERIRWESNTNDWRFDFGLSAAENPRLIRSFENTPREEAELFARMSWLGSRFAASFQATVVSNPIDGDELRLDGTYVGAAIGNWMLSAGWQERWWGPGNSGSLILSSNARPTPGLTLQRNGSTAFSSRWLRWLGPWTFTTFVDRLDDERTIEDSLLFGARFSFRPVRGLEFGFSRVAQWCGNGRPCDIKALFNMLAGKDNRGVNVATEDEPGNQLAGFDIRWVLPGKIPVALYMQWIGEDGSPRPAYPGSWLRQLGVEAWGTVGNLRHSTFIEVSDTACREGGFGLSEEKPNCAYNHRIFRSGFRYQGRVMAHGMDGDGFSYSLGSTLVQSGGHSWNVLFRFMEINQIGSPDPKHSVSLTPQDIADLQISHDRITAIGTFKLGLGYARVDDEQTAETSANFSAFVQWSSR